MRKYPAVICLLTGVMGFALPVSACAQDDKVITNSVGMKLALIPAGKFTMGSPKMEMERDDEELQHEVAITKPFYMGVYEVTQGQYQNIMGKNNSVFRLTVDHPVEQVPWRDAVQFCAKLSGRLDEEKAGRVYRLPTEAEWEYACRAGTKTVFHGGNTLSAKEANINGNHPYGGADKGTLLNKTAKVGSYKPNSWGLYDMHGNVAEWCYDYYDPNYYKSSPKDDPKGPKEGVVHTGYRKDYFQVVRGGCWLDEARACRAAFRFRLQPSEPYRWVGLRVVCEIKAK